MSGGEDTARAVERAARLSYGRLVAVLTARAGDPATAEDALAEALARALATWPKAGVPTAPEAWLLTVARRILVDGGRGATRAGAAVSHLERLEEERRIRGDWPDERLKLLFACAHPGIDRSIRAPLMLQCVLGLDARRIASAFLVAPNTMGVRLSRAKTKIRDGAIPFEIPAPQDAAARVRDALDAIYAAFTLGWDGACEADETGRELVAEAIWLGRLLRDLAPTEPEAADFCRSCCIPKAAAPRAATPKVATSRWTIRTAAFGTR